MNVITTVLIDWPRRIARYFYWLPPLIARIVVGCVFVYTGWVKLNDLPHITKNFVSWGIPYPDILTPFVSGLEFFGGILLIAGLFTRIAAAPLAVTMIVAIIAARWSDVDSAATLLGLEEVTYLIVFVWLAIAGPGPISLDRLLLGRDPDRRDVTVPTY